MKEVFIRAICRKYGRRIGSLPGEVICRLQKSITAGLMFPVIRQKNSLFIRSGGRIGSG